MPFALIDGSQMVYNAYLSGANVGRYIMALNILEKHCYNKIIQAQFSC